MPITTLKSPEKKAFTMIIQPSITETDMRRTTSGLVFIALLSLAVLTALVAPGNAQAMLEPLTFRDLVQESSAVVLADTTSVQSRLDLSGNPVTDVRLTVVRTLHGQSSDDHLITIPGGVVGDFVQHVTGQPMFGVGDRVILFLDGSGRVVGGSQGRFGVHADMVLETGETLAAFTQRLAAAARGLEAADAPAPATTAAAQSSVGALSAASVSAVSPSSVPGGAGATVIITGSGFGTTPGRVEFSHGSSTNNSGRIVRWTATSVEVEVPDAVSSGPVRVRTSAGTLSTPVNITIPYSLNGMAWTTRTVPFSISSAAPAGWQTMVRNGAIAWNGLANFAFSQSSAVAAPQRGNRVNEVWWGSTGANGHLAIASLSFFRDTDNNGDGLNDMVEADIIFSSDFAWGDGSGGTFDIHSVALHEFGHWLSLDDLYGTADTQKAMFGRIARGAQRRALTAGDIAGIRAIYGNTAAQAPTVARIAGANRYATAVQVSRGTFTPGSSRTVVMATGRNFADALSASGLASIHQSPLLLTSGVGAVVEPEVLQELRRLGAGSIILVGGTGAISSGVENALRTEFGEVRRIGGLNRFETAALVAREVAAPRAGSEYRGEVFIARGDAFADALSAAPYAYSQGMPILLVLPNAMPEHTANALAEIGATSAVVVGGQGAVGSAVTNVLTQRGVTWRRIQGACRFTTSEALLREAVARGWTSSNVVGLATGDNFPDALGGGAAAGARNGGLLLTRTSALPPSTASLLRELTPGPSRVEIYGGRGAVCDTVVTTVRGLWGIR